VTSVQTREVNSTGAGRFDGLSIVVSAPSELTVKLITGLGQLGVNVGVIGDVDGLPEHLVTVPAPEREREQTARALDAARTRLGGLDGVIYAPPLVGPGNVAFAEVDEATWVRAAEAPIWNSLVFFQAAFALFGDGGGSIVAVVPTIALTGGAGFVPFAAASEGIRQLVKSAARAWGRHGTRVNCLTAPIEEWGTIPGRPVPNRYGASLPGSNTSAELAGAAALLVDPSARGVTGATVGLDRGTVLAP
jgi:NAD(P)-dependent dehydrogenase (short-subunit alcohol dehydrogenase family)